jgi:ketosteroid isomerase-like protein
MRAVLSIFLFMSALLNTSCAPSGPVDHRAADAAAMRAADERWSAAAARHDLAGALSYYADDAVLLPPNAPIAKDQKSIREAWAVILGPNTTLSWKVSKAEVAKSGELGYLYGTYEDSTTNAKAGPPVRDTGKLVEIWKKQTDGHWKCIVDIYNSDLPVPAAPEAIR